jgi:hypothetical protein
VTLPQPVKTEAIRWEEVIYMSRVKIEDLKPAAKDLDVKEMKKLYGGISIIDGKTSVNSPLTSPFLNGVPDERATQILITN